MLTGNKRKTKENTATAAVRLISVQAPRADVCRATSSREQPKPANHIDKSALVNDEMN